MSEESNGSSPTVRMHRSGDDRMIAGVCGGLGRALGVDPVIFRIVLAVLAVFGGVGLLLYGAAWLLIPDDGTDESDGARLLHGRTNATSLVAIALGVIGILLVFGLTGTNLSGGLPVVLVIAAVAAVVVGRRPGGWLNRTDAGPAAQAWSRDRIWLVPVAIVVGVVGFVLFIAVARVALRIGNHGGYDYGYGYGRARAAFELLVVLVLSAAVVGAIVLGRRHLRSASTPGSIPSTAYTSAPTTTATSYPTAGFSTDPLGPPAGFSPSRPIYVPPPPRAPRAPREPSFVVPLTLSLAVVAVGVLLALGASGQVDISAQDLFAAALLATALGLVAGSWFGRGRLLIPVGIVLSVGLVIAAIVNVPLRGGIGSRLASAVTVAQLQSPYRLAVGNEDLELQNLQLAGYTTHVVVSVGVGHLFVAVPDDVKVVVRAYAGAGQTEVFGARQSGTHVGHTSVSVVPTGIEAPQAGELDLDLRVGAGQVDVIREPATAGSALSGGQS